MRSHLVWWVLGFALAGAGCKDPESAARQRQEQALGAKLAEGRRELAAGKISEAIAAGQAAAGTAPNDPRGYLLIADAQEQAGNDTAAILSLKQAVALAAGDQGVALQQRLASLYQRSGNPQQAIRVLGALLHQEKLADPEILNLARLQAHQGDTDGAFKTLEAIQRRAPDDPGAKVVEAEILLLKGEEVLAANLMDRLVTRCADAGQPADPAARCEVLPDAWLLRARYFLNFGRADLAQGDLEHITGPAAERPDVVQLKARVLNELKRHDDAERLLRGLLAKDPRDEEVLAQLAETILYEGKPAEAQKLVDEALSLRPTYARALYVRARALEAQGELKTAAENYQYALKSDPGFAPALSRIWRIYDHRGEKGEAMSALERLFFMNEASLEEKVALAELYADGNTNLTRGRKLIDEALRRDPDNARYREIRARLQKAGALGDQKGPIIIRGGR